MPDEFADVPENVKTLIEEVGFAHFKELMPDDDRAVFERAEQGKCMTCGAALGIHTLLFITRHGIVAVYCSGPCAQDMAVIGWVQEQHDDIQSSITFRGGGGYDATPEG